MQMAWGRQLRQQHDEVEAEEEGQQEDSFDGRSFGAEQEGDISLSDRTRADLAGREESTAHLDAVVRVEERKLRSMLG